MIVSLYDQHFQENLVNIIPMKIPRNIFNLYCLKKTKPSKILSLKEIPHSSYIFLSLKFSIFIAWPFKISPSNHATKINTSQHKNYKLLVLHMYIFLFDSLEWLALFKNSGVHSKKLSDAVYECGWFALIQFYQLSKIISEIFLWTHFLLL